MVTFCSLAARSISSNRLKSLLLPAGPSGPRPDGEIRAPACLVTGATPLASFMLLDGQCATPTPRALQDRQIGVVHPHGVRGDACGRSTRPGRRASCVGVMRALAPASSSFSFLVSERWISSGALYLLASARAAFRVSSELV